MTPPWPCWICTERGGNGMSLSCGHWEHDLLIWLLEGRVPQPATIPNSTVRKVEFGVIDNLYHNRHPWSEVNGRTQ